jgi:NADH-quinone oxidoreductase subunit E
MVQINDDYYEDLTENNFRDLLNNLKTNKSIKPGSQIGRQTSDPKRNN